MTTIPLARPLLAGSSDLPGDSNGPFDPAATPVPVNGPSSDPIRSDLIGWFTSLSPDQQNAVAGALGSEKLNELFMLLGMPPAL